MLPARTKATVRVNKDTDRAEAKKALASVKSPGGHRWDALPKARFAADSPLEEAGFELSVPPERKAFPRALDRFRRPSLRAPWEWDVKRRLRGVEFPVALFDAADALVPGNGGADMIWASALACSGDFLLRLTACQGKDLIAEAR